MNSRADDRIPSAFQSISETAASPIFLGEGRKPFLYEPAVERGVVSDQKHNPLQQIVDGLIVDALTGDHLIDDARDVRDLSRNREAGVLEPFPGAKDFVD